MEIGFLLWVQSEKQQLKYMHSFHIPSSYREIKVPTELRHKHCGRIALGMSVKAQSGKIRGAFNTWTPVFKSEIYFYMKLWVFNSACKFIKNVMPSIFSAEELISLLLIH